VDASGSAYVTGTMRTRGGQLPVNVRVLIEGEEETNSQGITDFVRDHASNLRSNVALISDTKMFAAELPTLCVGLRGNVSTQIEIKGPKTDMHSGLYGGAAPNPLIALAHIITALKDGTGTIGIPRFYDRVQRPNENELRSWESLPFNPEEFRTMQIGSLGFTGEASYSVLERIWSRPTLDVHGISGGFAGEGAEMVIPARASAKISMRLVPDQRPVEIFKLYNDFVHQIAPPEFQTTVRCLGTADPVVVATDNRFIQAAQRALEQAFHKKSVFARSGGSIPIVADFQNFLRIPSVLMGFGLPDDNPHAPNEKFHVPNFYRGIDAVILFLEDAEHSNDPHPYLRDSESTCH
jgi:acetylornithine deacetylase/succinyl-diaminopimelate desuccinylase-like protein